MISVYKLISCRKLLLSNILIYLLNLIQKTTQLVGIAMENSIDIMEYIVLGDTALDVLLEVLFFLFALFINAVLLILLYKVFCLFLSRTKMSVSISDNAI